MSSHLSTLISDVRELLDSASNVYAGTPAAAQVDLLRERLHAPLRVAIAGKVKAGKSTLLNALVGEQLAPTDEGECTRIVTWYQDGTTYQVRADLKSGESRQLPFDRVDGAVQVELGDLSTDQVERLEVTWPSSALRDLSLIDTPGIGSLTSDAEERAMSFLVSDEEPTAADAVLYLMKHLHATDIGFLEAFHDDEVSKPNPVNAIAVLSRADEIATGRLDAMASARKIAARYSSEPKVRRMVQTVVPVAGLLAESAATLTEAEFQGLALIGKLSGREAESLLLTTDRFVNSTSDVGLTSMEREQLLKRFGVFGIRLAATLLRQGTVTTASELSREMIARSGLDDLREILGSLFAERRDLLKARSALLALGSLIEEHPVPGADQLDADIERVVASAHPLNELRILSAVRSGWITAKEERLRELEMLLGADGQSPRARLGLPADADDGMVRNELMAALARWQRRAENPLTRHEMAVASRVAVRTCEGMFAAGVG